MDSGNTGYSGHVQIWHALIAMNNVFGITLRAQDGRERRTLVWLPTDDTRREFYRKAARNGLTIIENKD